MVSSRPRLVSSKDDPSDVKFYRLSLEREQARARRLTVWLVGVVALSLVLNGVLASWIATSNRRTDASSDARSRASAQELSAVRRQVEGLSSELADVRSELEKALESKIGTARTEMSELRRCLNDARTSLQRAVTKSKKRNVTAILKSLKLPACSG